MSGSAVGGRTASPEKLAVAKAIAAGETPIRVAPTDVPEDPYVEAMKRRVRTIKMRTNVSPDRDELLGETTPNVENPVATATDPAIAPPDTGGQVEPTVEATQPLSPQFAALAKQRRALQVKERELADREAALKSQPAQAGEDWVAKLKSQPLSVLKEHGVTYDQLTDAILAEQSGRDPEVALLKQEIQTLKEGLETKFTERDKQAEQQVLADMTREAEELVKTGDEYEMVRRSGSARKAIELIERTWRKTGEVLDVQEALALVEDKLITDALKLAEADKVRKRLLAAQTPQAPAQRPPAPERQMRTLTNRDNAAPVLSRRARALLAFRGQLKG
jgi:hypothetical protein